MELRGGRGGRKRGGLKIEEERRGELKMEERRWRRKGRLKMEEGRVENGRGEEGQVEDGGRAGREQPSWMRASGSREAGGCGMVGSGRATGSGW